MKTLNLTPNYQALFNLAKELVRAQVDKNDGQDFVIEMLEYGQRMDKRDSESKPTE